MQDTEHRIRDTGYGIQDTAPPLPAPPGPILKFFGEVKYQATWQAMKDFTLLRDSSTRDEIWLLQHPPTYTQGQAGKPEHLLNARNIPVVQIDRGGQITYHGPGQIVAYLLLDLHRWKLNVRQLVRLMEQAVIDILAGYGIAAQGREDAPGVYVGDAKIAALGLKIKNGCCYHGLAFNIDMDLTPYHYINPCGYQGLRVTQLRDFGVQDTLEVVRDRLAQELVELLLAHWHAHLPSLQPPSRGEGAQARNPVLEEKLKLFARDLRAQQSDAEQRIWYLLRNRNFFGYKFRRQHPLANYILDFYCADARLAIELDGGQHAENRAYDTHRTQVLQQHGIQVLRFWNHDVLQNTEGVLQRIAEALLSSPQTASPHPNPLPINGAREQDALEPDMDGAQYVPSPRLRGEG